MPVAPTDIFDRVAGWGHSAATNHNFSTGTDLTVQAFWGNPITQTAGDDTDLNDSTHLPTEAQIGILVARDGVAATVSYPVPTSIATRNSTTNGVTTTPEYFLGFTGEAGDDARGDVYGKVLNDRTYGWGHDEESSAAALTYNSDIDIAANQGGSTTTPYDTGAEEVELADVLPATDQTKSVGWAGLYDRTAGWGHASGGGGTVTEAGSTVNIPVAHD